MYVGSLRLELHIQSSYSLKDKRRVLKSLQDRLRRTFQVAVAEVGDQELWQKAVIGVSCVSGHSSLVNETLQKVLSFVENIDDLEILTYEIDLY